MSFVIAYAVLTDAVRHVGRSVQQPAATADCTGGVLINIGHAGHHGSTGDTVHARRREIGGRRMQVYESAPGHDLGVHDSPGVVSGYRAGLEVEHVDQPTLRRLDVLVRQQRQNSAVPRSGARRHAASRG